VEQVEGAMLLGGRVNWQRNSYTIIKRPVDPTRKRFYLVDTDVHRSTTDLELLNENELLGPESPSACKSVRVFSCKDVDGRDQYYSGTFGLPKFYATPRIKVGSRNKLLDFYIRSGRKYVSPRAKTLLESIDPDAFDFVECDTITRHKVQIEPYWMLAVKRAVTEFDEERSVYRERGGRDPRPVPANLAVTITNIYDIRMSPDMPDNYHAFYLIKYLRHFIFDEVIVDAWRAAKFNGLMFSPLQPPTTQELKFPLYYLNSRYFYEDYRHEWEDLI
jgi:Protein of unknown function (DUF1629)